MIASSAGSAAYEGYKYEHKKNPSAATSSTKKTTSTAKAPRHTIPDSEIE